MIQTITRMAVSLGLLLASLPAAATPANTEPYPVSIVLSDARADILRPSVAGKFLVYSERRSGAYRVVQASVNAPASEDRVIAPTLLREAVRFGVAVRDGSVGYESNRMGPVSAWIKQARGDGHVLLANLGTFSGALVPMNLNASPDGRIWCFDSTLEKVLQSRAISQFGDINKHMELLGQTWRFYNSDAFQHKMGYRATRTGNASKFEHPALFLFDTTTSRLVMIPNAMSGAISPDGRRVAFVREVNGNYDIWVQDLDGGHLTQITSSPFGDFDPAWSPDGKRLAFASNRDSKGNVRATSIYVLDLATGAVERATAAGRATDAAPAWRDDRTILFQSNRDPRGRGTAPRWSIWQVRLSR